MIETEDLNRHRRRFLGLLGAGALITGFPAISTAATSTKGHRSLSLYNLHTSESLKADYWIEGSYQPDVLDKVNFLLRDHRSDDVGMIDKNLLDLLHKLSSQLGTRKELGIVCGYRSPETNESLRGKKRGVAKNSYHVKGMAVDLRIPDRSPADIYFAARRLNIGGVGYYGRSKFVHVDVGPSRTWGPRPKA